MIVINLGLASVWPATKRSEKVFPTVLRIASYLFLAYSRLHLCSIKPSVSSRVFKLWPFSVVHGTKAECARSLKDIQVVGRLRFTASNVEKMF